MKALDVMIKICLLFALSFLTDQIHAQTVSEVQTLVVDQKEIPRDLRFYQPRSLPTQSIMINTEDPMSRLGFVCKWEHENDKKSTVPLRFRLGNLDYVNKLEGK